MSSRLSSGSGWSLRGDARRSNHPQIPVDHHRDPSMDPLGATQIPTNLGRLQPHSSQLHQPPNHPLIATISPAHLSTAVFPPSHPLSRGFFRTPYPSAHFYDLRHAHPALNGLAFQAYPHHQYLQQLHGHMTQPDVTNIRHFIRPYWARPSNILANPWGWSPRLQKEENGPGPPDSVQDAEDEVMVVPDDDSTSYKDENRITAFDYSTVSLLFISFILLHCYILYV